MRCVIEHTHGGKVSYLGAGDTINCVDRFVVRADIHYRDLGAINSDRSDHGWRRGNVPARLESENGRTSKSIEGIQNPIVATNVDGDGGVACR